jgi:hypothetical protein
MVARQFQLCHHCPAKKNPPLEPYACPICFLPALSTSYSNFFWPPISSSFEGPLSNLNGYGRSMKYCRLFSLFLFFFFVLSLVPSYIYSSFIISHLNLEILLFFSLFSLHARSLSSQFPSSFISSSSNSLFS